MADGSLGLATEVIDAIMPLLTQKRREGLLQYAFTDDAGRAVLDRIDFSGANDVFTPALVRQLILFGEVTAGNPAIIVLLRSLGGALGVEKKARLDDLNVRLREYLSQDPQKLRELVEEIQIKASTSMRAAVRDGKLEFPVTVEPVSGVIWFGRPGGEEKDLQGGRFRGELTVRVSVTSTKPAVRVTSLELDCISKPGIHAAPLSQVIDLVTDASGTVATQRLATLSGQFVNELAISPGNSKMLTITTDFAARAMLYPYQWDFGFLQLRGLGSSRAVLFDVTYQYEGARSIVQTDAPEIPWFGDAQLELLLDLGYMNWSEIDVLQSIRPDERMLLLWDRTDDCWGNSAARTVIGDVWSRLHPKSDVAFLKSQGPIFPPPFPSQLGAQRQVVVELADGQREIILPSSPVRPDCIWAVVSEIYINGCRAQDRKVQLSSVDPGSIAQVIYIEAGDSLEEPGFVEE
jgi:hypothetical protein